MKNYLKDKHYSSYLEKLNPDAYSASYYAITKEELLSYYKNEEDYYGDELIIDWQGEGEYIFQYIENPSILTSYSCLENELKNIDLGFPFDINIDFVNNSEKFMEEWLKSQKYKSIYFIFQGGNRITLEYVYYSNDIDIDPMSFLKKKLKVSDDNLFFNWFDCIKAEDLTFDDVMNVDTERKTEKLIV